MLSAQTQKWLSAYLQGDIRALARLLTYVDNQHPETFALLAYIEKQRTKSSPVFGITGPPGAGKSTLVNELIKVWRSKNKRVAVLAIDPSSPFTGGAILGDRIRMQDHNADQSVYIRSLGTHGAHGGLSLSASASVALLKLFGFDIVIIETVGVGQTELDIMAYADLVSIVLVPESGDSVQTLKAGLMEIADVFVVNKSDREGADRLVAELSQVGDFYDPPRTLPVLKTSAMRGQGCHELISCFEDTVLTASAQKSKEMLLEQGVKLILERQWQKQKIQPKIAQILEMWRHGKKNFYEMLHELELLLD